MNVAVEPSQAAGGGEPQRPTPNAKGTGIYAIRDRAVAEVLALTGDESSQRRLQQLWEIAEKNGVLKAWQVAVRAVQRRARTTSGVSLDRPGAYFCTVCVQELEKHQVFVPTAAEKHAEAGITEQIRESLFAEEGLPGNDDGLSQRAGEPVQRLALMPPAASVSATKSAHQIPADLSPADLERDLAALECKGGAPYEAFLAYVADERKRYESELAGMRPTSRQRLLAAFDRLEKRRDLYRRMCSQLTDLNP